MATLQEMLAPELAPQFVADCQALIDGEVDGKGGLSGTAVKAAYKVVTAFAPGYYTETIRAIAPDMIDALEPFWADFLGSGTAEFGDYLAKRGDEVSEALLAVTDHMADVSGRAAIVKAYKMVRGSAGKNIEASLPNLGAMIQSYS
ncbi:MAG TPA: hypothetical protein VHZ33_11810 [Trebonia sp.]|jgi:hypothetical protein|nr:hypothetical protein [Trebonia sp.]